jgi:formylglycine-generating enzyme required for sulfatase activity
MRNAIIMLILFPGAHLFATDLRITNVVFNGSPSDNSNPTITAWLTVSWKNSWRNDKNHDAAWIFFKLDAREKEWSKLHGVVKTSGYQLIHNYNAGSANPSFFVPDDGAGLMIFPDRKYRGDVSWRIKVQLDVAKIEGLQTDDLVYVFAEGLEMVYIPQGSFFLGEADTTAQRQASSFYEYGSLDYYRITSEDAIQVGAAANNLYYTNNNQADYRGDMKGPVPPAFPKGYKAFYIMKYEMSEGNYAAFLNSIGVYYSHNRANFGGRNYYAERGGIFLADDEYQTKSPERPANFTSWEDECAFADWAGLRPMTEFEYEKACRGSVKPAVSNSFGWGTSSKEKLSRYYSTENNLGAEHPLQEKDLADTNLEFYGASYYWVLDLNSSLWERCVSAGSEKGRHFQGTHGDGRLSSYTGNATNADWPNGYDNQGGISYRGGGTYLPGMVGAPLGQTGHRPFGAWSEAPRSLAYGFRAVRTAGK